MAGATSSIGAAAQLGKSQQAQSLFRHHNKGAKSGKALGNQQQFATLLAGKQTVLQNSAAPGGGSRPAPSSAAPSTAPTGQGAQESNFNALLAG